MRITEDPLFNPEEELEKVDSENEDDDYNAPIVESYYDPPNGGSDLKVSTGVPSSQQEDLRNRSHNIITDK